VDKGENTSKTDKNFFYGRIYRVEEALNRRACANGEETQKRTDIDAAIQIRISGPTAADYVLNKLYERGFRLKNGEADWVRFYKHARIEPDVWSTFCSGTHAPSKETLLKIIIGLRLNETEAREFLALAGSGFRSDDRRDRVILACMDCGYYDAEDVYMILEEYGGTLVHGKRLFKNIYRSIE